jgi:hypothetical protein
LISETKQAMKPTASYFRCIILISMMPGWSCLGAQAVSLSGGTSTLYQSQGGTISVHGPSYNASLGAGMIGGEFFGGAQLVKNLEHGKLTLGTDNIPFDLPTDIFESGHYLTALGAGMRGKVGSTNVYAFAGAISTSFNSPFFEGARAEMPAAVLLASGRVSPHWTGTTSVIISQQTTIINSLSRTFSNGLKLAFAAGLGSNQPYFAASGSITQPRFDLKVAYIEMGSQFRRANVAVPLTTEPDRENILVTIRPATPLSFTIGRQNNPDPISQSSTSVRSVVNEASGNFQVAGFGLSTMLFRSTYEGSSNTAIAYSVSQAIGARVHAEASYLVSRPEQSAGTDSLVANIEETLSTRLSLSHTINISGGQQSIGFGGTFLSNFATLKRTRARRLKKL